MSPAARNWRSTLYVLMLVLVAVLLVTWWPELTGVWRGHSVTFAIAIVLMCAGMMLQAVNFVSFMEHAGFVRKWPLARIWALSALVNYAGPFQPGIAVRVGYLRKRGVPVAEGLLAVWRQTTVTAWMALAGFAVGLFAIGEVGEQFWAAILSLSFIAVYLLRSFLRSTLEKLSRPSWLVERKQILIRAVSRISAIGIIGVALQFATGAVLLLWCYSRFGADIRFGDALVLASVVYVSSLVAVVPGNLGVMEGIYLLGGHGLGLSVEEAAALAFLLRGSHVTGCLVLLVAGPPIRWSSSD